MNGFAFKNQGGKSFLEFGDGCIALKQFAWMLHTKDGSYLVGTKSGYEVIFRPLAPSDVEPSMPEQAPKSWLSAAKDRMAKAEEEFDAAWNELHDAIVAEKEGRS